MHATLSHTLQIYSRMYKIQIKWHYFRSKFLLQQLSLLQKNAKSLKVRNTVTASIRQEEN